ncbi:lipoprotein precursor [Flavobacterium cauense R2A-7]|uniref:Lipoprotein n=1 Tax=Flavobacterium cauense R2A-7 TaxID=1341154 RepID=V6S2B9_9FLAO|nr:DUF6146 family protein [Flavobacterium cauense]ESU18535.1 lipoprotein precursor [Flavobacterium cauense R2A-7]KGO80625.1 hypothetical protein Q762_11090 [Flavobacterium cauense R2A-7]TWI11771.1 hypothetical protein IP98_01939 [Flavobacterium cauense R2A-7]
MKNGVLLVIFLFMALLFGCDSSTKPISDNSSVKALNDTVRIVNKELDYEVTIIDPGFNSWLQSTARPRGFYTQAHLESRNIPWIIEWNNRARSPKNSRDRDLFQMEVNYQNGINYGYEVNYLIYNYLVYFQIKNNIRLGGFTPRP